MAIDERHLNPVESALVELQEAEQAGVFRRTSVDARRLAASESAAATGGSRHPAMRLLPVAAAVLFVAVTVWTWMFRGEFSELRQQRHGFVTGVAPREAERKSFAECMSGPSATKILDSCREHDRNGDGFIDLRDFSSLQLASAHVVP